MEHGTLTGYNYHRCRCDDCRAANAASMRRARENPVQKAADRLSRTAERRALVRLRRRHTEEYQGLYAQELSLLRTGQ